MWRTIFITLGLIYGALAVISDSECLLQVETDCQVWSIAELDFPTNIEDLRLGCLHVDKVKRCISDTLSNCSPDEADDNRIVYDKFHELLDDEASIKDSRRLKDMELLIDLATEICDENSELHRKIVPYLPCIRSTMSIEYKDDCMYYQAKAVSFLRSRIERKVKMAGDNEDKIGRELKICLRMLMTINCIIIKIMKSCDSGLKQPLLEIMKKGRSQFFQCPDSVRIDAIELLGDLKLLTRQEIYIKELLQVDTFFYGCDSSQICLSEK